MKILLLFFTMLFCLGCALTIHAEESVPFWIKNNAMWWSADKISDGEFAHGVDWLIFDGLLNVSSSVSENEIPFWFKNTADYWTHNLISETEFLNALEYLLEENILTVKRSVSLPDYQKHQFSGNNEFFTIYAYEKDFYFENNNPIPKDIQFLLKSDIEHIEDILYDSRKQNSAVVMPIFTSSAYWEPGFYTFYRNECSAECLTTKIEYSKFLGYSGSSNAVKILSLLGYPLITDIDIDKDPNLLDTFDSVILLHNEYVTQKEFESITNHPNVLYLYPNALYAEIEANYDENIITLIRGHTYPEKHIDNGFDWEFDNTRPYEFDTDCLDWNFYSIPNGHMLNCFPENLIIDDFEFLKEIKNLTLKK